jgi:hypothetical protein
MNSVIVRTKVKNSSIRISNIDGTWYVIPVGFAGMHLTTTEVESIMDAFREATEKAESLNAMRNTENLFVENTEC